MQSTYPDENRGCTLLRNVEGQDFWHFGAGSLFSFLPFLRIVDFSYRFAYFPSNPLPLRKNANLSVDNLQMREKEKRKQEGKDGDFITGSFVGGRLCYADEG